ncbi:MAG: glycosyltransferase, partial [Desulfomonilaceae bacterium]
RDPNLILAVGRILPHKGFDRIIRSLKNPLRLTIAGTNYNTNYFRYLTSLARSSCCTIEIVEGLTDDQIRKLFRQATLFVHASTHFDHRGVYYPKPELLGLAPLEALSCGTPTLVSTAGALNELTCISGCLSFTDDDELSALLSMHANKSLKMPPADDIHRQVVERYGMKRFGIDLINELLILGND